MNFSIFKEEVIRELEGRLPENFKINSNRVLKNNSVVLEGLMIKEGDQSVVPSIYLEPFFDKFLSGYSIPKIVDDIIKLYEETVNRPGTLKKFEMSRADIIDNLYIRLVSFERNQELLRDSIYFEVLDLAAVVYFCVEKGQSEVASARLTQSLCERYKIDGNEAMEKALVNTEKLFPPVVKPMADVLENLKYVRNSDVQGLKEYLDVPMYVLTNSSGLNGASCLLYEGLLEELYKRFEEDFYILPSSIHEVILMPTSACPEVEMLTDLVTTINREEINDMEILSDRVYHFPIDRFEY